MVWHAGVRARVGRDASGRVKGKEQTIVRDGLSTPKRHAPSSSCSSELA
jgi:hypothetical protein